MRLVGGAWESLIILFNLIVYVIDEGKKEIWKDEVYIGRAYRRGLMAIHLRSKGR